ncbi:uncharacterized protein BYT42DRAFT_551456 [Radiomyces spectabilis]|uniref:uncharacterized protein n=1 Tax=Radiomyces spectabilis TaxID=64574 RepID=UPI00221FEFC9|nr:uncharacterized protein BYT42DRAFT_551456 [Radiomyces spectabilis]KAI8393561.1 hypothetical protein BYT42DRAFT_551456 [Radiomyces spectabilis]
MLLRLIAPTTFLSLLVGSFLVGAQNATETIEASIPPQSSPVWLSNIQPIPGNTDSYPLGDVPTGPLETAPFALQNYPPGWKSPPVDSPDVQAVIKALDWSQVPNITVRKAGKGGDVDMGGYDDKADPDCWWTATGCTQSTRPNIPPDIFNCPIPGDWGLTYDDGPLPEDDDSQWAEPRLYDFLAEHKQKASLFYIGSNVIAAPAAARRALADGHTLCSHTWSHPSMTAQSNEVVVAELYWTLRAIKEVTGVTAKCWRPPYGDVDDRVRAIAWQMGMTTVTWDLDTDDWNMPGSGGGHLSPSVVDGYFQGWIDSRANGTDNATGHVVLQHELNNSTVSMAEKWLPEIQKVFRVMPHNQCHNIQNPYWETNFVYPTNNGSSAAIPEQQNNNSSVPAASGEVASSDPSSPSSLSSGQDTDMTSNAYRTIATHTYVSTLLLFLGLIVQY